MEKLFRIECKDSIESLLKQLQCRQKTSAVLLWGGYCLECRLQIISGESLSLLAILAEDGPDYPTEADLPILCFNIEQSIYFFPITVSAMQKNLLYLKAPTLVYTNLRRYLPRNNIDKSDRVTAFTWNDQDEKQTHHVRDINVRGMSFLCGQPYYSTGQLIQNVLITFEDKAEVVLDVIVKYCIPAADGMHHICGMSFCTIEERELEIISAYIFNKNFGNVIDCLELSADTIYQFTLASGGFTQQDEESRIVRHREMMHVADELHGLGTLSFYYAYTNFFNTIAEDHSHKTQTLAADISAIYSLLRIYDATFYLNHCMFLLAATDGEPSGTAAADDAEKIMRIHSSITTTLICHRYFRYYLDYFTLDAAGRSVYKNFTHFIDDPNKFQLDYFELFHCDVESSMNFKDSMPGIDPPVETSPGLSGTTTSPSGADMVIDCTVLEDTSAFIEYAMANISPLENEAYGYNSLASLQLGDIKQLFGMVKLYLSRCVWVVSRGGKTLGYAVSEVYSNGLNLRNQLDLTRIFFAETMTPEDRRSFVSAVVRKCAAFYSRFNKSSFGLLFKVDLDDVDIYTRENIRYFTTLGRVIGNKDSIIEYCKFLSIRQELRETPLF